MLITIHDMFVECERCIEANFAKFGYLPHKSLPRGKYPNMDDESFDGIYTVGVTLDDVNQAIIRVTPYPNFNERSIYIDTTISPCNPALWDNKTSEYMLRYMLMFNRTSELDGTAIHPMCSQDNMASFVAAEVEKFMSGIFDYLAETKSMTPLQMARILTEHNINDFCDQYAASRKYTDIPLSEQAEMFLSLTCDMIERDPFRYVDLPMDAIMEKIFFTADDLVMSVKNYARMVIGNV